MSYLKHYVGQGREYIGILYYDKKLPNGEIVGKPQIRRIEDRDSLSPDALADTIFTLRAKSMKEAKQKYLNQLGYHRELLGAKRIRVSIGRKEFMV